MSHHTLDARGLLCPMPVIRTQNAANELAAGDHLEVLCTDPGALIDIPTWCRINGHRVLGAYRGEDVVTILIEVGGK